MLDKIEHMRWIQDCGDIYHNLNYDLNEKSVVMDLGGYKGVWVQKIIDKYNPNIYIIEPVFDFYNFMVDKFSDNSKVKLMNVGVGTENKKGAIYIDSDKTSSSSINSKSVEVEFNTIDTILKKWNLNKIDLIQINIEGDEYSLLENMLDTGSINKFKNIQIQFHIGIENYLFRRDEIRKGLIKNNFKINFEYPFVWESWRKRNV